MNQGKYIFAQLTEFLPRRTFDRIVKEHNGNKYIRTFICWNQMLCMVFGQLTSRDSMRDLILSLEAHQAKYYHLGFGPTVSRRNLGTANEKRSCKIFEEFAYVLIDQARRSCYRSDFVTRAKDNLRFKRMYSRPVNKNLGLQCDQIGKLETYYSKKDFTDEIRRIIYYDQERDKSLIFLTNNTDLKAEEIAYLYKKRWEVELFFKWMKQHLKIKSFWGTTLNAVKIQMYCAIIAYCLVAIVGNQLKVDRPIYEILQVLSISLLDKSPVREILTRCDYKNVKEQNFNQLKISGF